MDRLYIAIARFWEARRVKDKMQAEHAGLGHLRTCTIERREKTEPGNFNHAITPRKLVCSLAKLAMAHKVVQKESMLYAVNVLQYAKRYQLC